MKFSRVANCLRSRSRSKLLPCGLRLAGSNSTRTESLVGIRPNPEAASRANALKLADHNT